ncbi:MAG: ChaN family lipoprotein [Candidatus Cloacimonadales bacterium]|jgi:uncharacterized iron-regulated protein|nr:ChaN family lipoprotein [Candidatus Cloacimonadota bacterium]MDY0381696.1 ChaN family lipoprotein [Candidatus Cloacimonadaceae bacterium]HCM14866.1 ABC transporter permease [Candidatus Cloacimonas sp.]MCB5256765.1 ChaN family lipoprotein [Candidatus Cloacimonadota bacterium]MCB5263984.1 ChaN family lipoprotein [Candidatus Cloacimonadota bacterium]
MKLLVIIALLIAISAGYAQIYFVDTEDSAKLTVHELAQQLQEFDVIFFGEWHGIESIHEAQAVVTEALAEDSANLILSFEMWERDSQPVLDSFLQGDIPEEQFVAQSRIWTNYENYRPLLMIAKDYKMTVIAANVPRVYAGRVVQEGWDFIDSLPSGERGYIAQRLSAPEDDYKREFMLLMNGMGGHQYSAETMHKYYLAQCIKDDTMAESIALAKQANPEARIIHFNGDFHSRSFLGTVSRLRTLMPEIKIAVISPEAVTNFKNPQLPDNMASLATYLLLSLPID